MRPRDGRYELIAGERRWRAAHAARLDQDPRRRERRRRSDAADARADRESPARRPLADRRGRGLPATRGEEFQLPHGEIARLVGRNRSTDREPASTAASSRTRCRRWCTSGNSPRATPGRCSALAEPEAMIALAQAGRRTRAGRCARSRRGSGETRPRHRSCARAGAPPRSARRPSTVTADAGGSRTHCASAWAPMCGSRPAGGAAASSAQLLLQRRSRPPARADPRSSRSRDEAARLARSPSSSSRTAPPGRRPIGFQSGCFGPGRGFWRPRPRLGARGRGPVRAHCSGRRLGSPGWSGSGSARGGQRQGPRT